MIYRFGSFFSAASNTSILPSMMVSLGSSWDTVSTIGSLMWTNLFYLQNSAIRDDLADGPKAKKVDGVKSNSCYIIFEYKFVNQLYNDLKANLKI